MPLARLLLVTLLVACSSSPKTDAAPDVAAADVDPADATTSADVALDAVDAAADATPQVIETPKDPHTLVVMTYNVMCSFCPNSDHPEWPQDWPTRLPMVKDTFARYNPDIMGIQELFDPDPASHMLQDLTEPEGVYATLYFTLKPGDKATGLGDSEAFHKYPDASIFYRKSRFEVLDQGATWLSPTPDVAYSAGFANGGQFPRLMYWAKLHDKLVNRDFVFASTHFDNNTPSQKLSAPLMLDTFAPMAAQLPVIFVGDFNSQPTDEAYTILANGKDGKGFHFQNAHELAVKVSVETNRTPPPPLVWTDRIDHFWLAGATFDVPLWVIDFHAYPPLGMWPSDHEPLVALIHWQ